MVEVIIILLSLAAGGFLGRLAKARQNTKGARPAPPELDLKAACAEPPDGMIKLVRIDPTGENKYRPVLCPADDVCTWAGVSSAIETCYPGCGKYVVFSRDNNEIPGFFWEQLFMSITKKSRVFWVEYGPSSFEGQKQDSHYDKIASKKIATARGRGKYYQG